MDPLKKEVFEALRGVTTGDEKIDDSLKTVAAHIKGILRAHGAAIEHVDRNKGQYTPAGLEVQRTKVGKKARKDLQEIQEKSNWKSKIEAVEKRFDDIESESDIKIFIRESREREIRALMRGFEGDSLLFEANFGELIRGGDRHICGAIKNSPLPLQIDPALEKIAVEGYRLSKNPLAADRLKTLQAAQDIHGNLFNFAMQELGLTEDITGFSS